MYLDQYISQIQCEEFYRDLEDYYAWQEENNADSFLDVFESYED